MPDFNIRPLRTHDDFRAAEGVQRAAWRSDELDIDPDLALAWRLQIRSICEDPFEHGYSVMDYIYEPGPPARSYYVFQQLQFDETG